MSNSISLCMIMRNEERYLAFALYCIRNIVDEIIIVDSGSTDKSIEIAQAFDAYILKAPWRNDFSFHRNLACVNATKDFILWSDADEVFSSEDIFKIKNVLAKTNNVDFWIMNRYNFWKDLNYCFCYPDGQYKLYRNKEEYRWKGNIHEYVFDKKNPNHIKLSRQSDINLYHYAYMKSPTEVSQKMSLYIEIENPNMDKEKIKKCSVEHSYFNSKLPPEVTPFNGKLPTVFQEITVTNSEIRENKTGNIICRFTNKKSVGVVDQIFEKDYAQEITNKKKEENLEKYPNFFKYEINDAVRNSICIATYNQWTKLKDCVESIYQKSHSPFEILIGANSENPDENILQDLEKRFSNIRVFRLGKNYGFAKAYNYLASQAFGKNLIILNDDTLIMTDDWIEKLIKYFYSTLDAGIIGMKSNFNPSENGGFENGPKKEWLLDQCKEWLKNNKLENGLIESSWITALAIILNRDVIKGLNNELFCEEFKIGEMEDTDLVFRIQHRIKSLNSLPRRSRCYVAKDLFLYHFGQSTLKTISNWQEIHDENLEILKRKWPEIFKNERK